MDLKESYFNDGVRFFENFDGFKNNMKIAAAHKGKKHDYSSTANKICVNDGQHNKFISEDEMSHYQHMG